MPRGKGIASDSNQPAKDSVHWNDDMDKLLLNALSEEANKGNRHDGAWTTQAYSNMVEDLRSAIGPNITKNHIKNRMKTLKTHFAEVYDLFHSLSGFAWNPTTGKFEAEEEVWDDLIRVKPHAARWKKMQIRHYDTLKELFAADRATGKQATTAKERLKQWERDLIDLNDYFEDEETRQPDVSMFDAQEFSTPNFDSFSPQNGQPNQTTDTAATRGTKRKRNMTDIMEAQYERMNDGILSLVEALKDGDSLSNKLHQVAERQVEIAEKQLTLMQQTRPRHYSESDVWDLLEELNVPDEFRMKCYDYLCDNEQKKRKLFGVPPQLRAQALIQIMTDANMV